MSRIIFLAIVITLIATACASLPKYPADSTSTSIFNLLSENSSGSVGEDTLKIFYTNNQPIEAFVADSLRFITRPEIEEPLRLNDANFLVDLEDYTGVNLWIYLKNEMIGGGYLEKGDAPHRARIQRRNDFLPATATKQDTIDVSDIDID